MTERCITAAVRCVGEPWERGEGRGNAHAHIPCARPIRTSLNPPFNPYAPPPPTDSLARPSRLYLRYSTAKAPRSAHARHITTRGVTRPHASVQPDYMCQRDGADKTGPPELHPDEVHQLPKDCTNHTRHTVRAAHQAARQRGVVVRGSRRVSFERLLAIAGGTIEGSRRGGTKGGRFIGGACRHDEEDRRPRGSHPSVRTHSPRQSPLACV